MNESDFDDFDDLGFLDFCFFCAILERSIDRVEQDLAENPNISVESFQVTFQELENQRQLIRQLFNFLNSQE
jgi:hypothetical protein